MSTEKAAIEDAIKRLVLTTADAIAQVTGSRTALHVAVADVLQITGEATRPATEALVSAILATNRHVAVLREANLAGTRLARWLTLLPARMVSRRVQTEVVGDGIERIEAVIRAGGSKRAVRFVYASVILTVVGEIVRYWARALKGGKAGS